MGYGGSAPPPPPDYTAEKGVIRRQTEARYADQADAFNSALTNYNQQIGNLYGNARNLSNQVDGLSFGDLDQSTFSNLQNQRSSLYDQAVSTRLSQPRPTFSSSVGSEYGMVGITNIPTLMNQDQQARSQLYNTLNEVDRELSSLWAERQNEQRRIGDFRSGLRGNAASLYSRASGLGIGDEAQMNSLRDDLASLNAQRQSFSSPILSQVAPDGFTQVDNRVSQINSLLDSLESERQAEQQRINQYETGLRGFSDQVYGQLGDLSITDIDQVSSLRDEIADRQRQAGRFSSELGFDFSDELGELSQYDRQLNDLILERQREQDRIQSAQEDYLNRARALGVQSQDGSIYSAAGIRALEDELNRLQGNISGFETPLQADFSTVDPVLEQARASLAELEGRRQSSLDNISSAVPEATGGLSDIALSDEQAIRDRLTQLRDAQSQLAPFSGGRVEDINTQIQSGIEQVNSRLQELTDYRAQIEQRAQEILSQVQDSTFLGLDELGNPQSGIDEIRAEAELYNAQQAMDEIDSVIARLNEERQRLERDASNVNARQQEAIAEIEQSLNAAGLPSFQNFAQTEPLTIEQYARRFNLNEDEEQDLRDIAENQAFSRALGVIRVG